MNDIIRQKLDSLPSLPGSYQMRDNAGNIIYVGKALNLKNRVSSYFVNSSSHNEKTLAMISHIEDFTYIVTPTELDALCLEANLIKKHQPYYNILLKDGKAFAYIKLNFKNPYPRIDIVRKVKNDGSKYFGPYFNGVNPREIIDLISHTFKLRTCNYKFSEEKPLKKACLYYSLGLCSAPCINKVSRAQYRKQVDMAVEFLNGHTKTVKDILAEKMLTQAKDENFEGAIIYKNLLATLDKLNAKIVTQLSNTLTCDVFGYSFDGEYSCVTVMTISNGRTLGVENFIMSSIESDKENQLSEFMVQYYSQNKIIPKLIIIPFNIKDKSILENYFISQKETKTALTHPIKGTKKQLSLLADKNAVEYLYKNIDKQKQAELLTTGAVSQLKEYAHLNELPLRIEGYDISNISGTNVVASMVVFINGEPSKMHYRKFKIKTVKGQDDFACMNEVLSRRMEEYDKQSDISFSARPNLILIDGGKGQLSSAVLGISKKMNCDVISLAKRIEEIFKPYNSYPIILPHNTYALRLLQRVRDESHRFAITFHRSLRSKQMTSSSLTNIEGIGKTKQAYLIEHFRSFNKIKTATTYELLQVNKITKTDAKNITDYYSNNDK